MQLTGLSINWYLVLFVFCATLCSYNFHYILAGAIADKKLSTQLFLRKPVACFFLGAGFLAAVIAFNQTGISITNVCMAALLTFIYSIPLLPFKQLAFVRKAGFLKTLLLAFTWAFVTAYLPLAAHTPVLTTLGWLILAKRFLFMLMLCILFDNRDIAVDKVHGLHSLATDLSPKTMQWVIFTVFGALFILNFFFGREGVAAAQVAALQLSSAIALLVYFFSTKKQGYFFYYFIVDGMMVLMTLLTTVASI